MDAWLDVNGWLYIPCAFPTRIEAGVAVASSLFLDRFQLLE